MAKVEDRHRDAAQLAIARTVTGDDMTERVAQAIADAEEREHEYWSARMGKACDRMDRMGALLREAHDFHVNQNGCRLHHSRDDCPGCHLVDRLRVELRSQHYENGTTEAALADRLARTIEDAVKILDGTVRPTAEDWDTRLICELESALAEHHKRRGQ